MKKIWRKYEENIVLWLIFLILDNALLNFNIMLRETTKQEKNLII